MELKTRYKLNNIRLLPEHWSVERIGDFSFVTKLAGFEYTKFFDYSKNGEIIVIRALNIKKGKLDLKEIHTIPKSTSDLLPRSKLSKGDLVISYVGTLGQVAVIQENEKYHLAPNVAKIVPNQNFINPIFFNQYLNSDYGQKEILNGAASTTQAALSMKNLRDVLFILPPLPEQNAIAEALSNVDALIFLQEELIAKKCAIKQGVMQELLTGKKRLAGFRDNWVIKKMEDFVEIHSGGTPSTMRQEYWDGNIPWCTPTDITALKKTKYIYQTNRMITELGLKNCSAEIIPSNSIIMTSRATIGECAINKFPISTNQGFKNLIPNNNMDVEFLYYILQTKKQELISLSSGSTFLEINKGKLAKVRFYLPDNKSEQMAIAEILSSMDLEIDLLEVKLKKIKLIKLGMMQELLTGRIRLIKE